MQAAKMAVIVQSAIFVMTSLILVFVAGKERQQPYSGRHMCTQARHVTHPVPVRQSYRRPVYRKDLQRVSYQVAYRTVFRMQIRAQLVQGCCPGWEKRNPEDKHCLKPVCKNECEHGKCVGPELCMCDAGYSGRQCQIELDECTGRHKCQHKCINTIGSYECACHDGFKLADDKLSCNLCLSCIGEFQEMQRQLQNLTQKIENLEEEKHLLESNLTSAVSQYEEAVSAFQAKEPPTQTPPPDTTTSIYGPYMMDHMPLDRLASLSEQISILEERMADCMCNNGGPQYYPMG
ncbi:epidermal growth factor-like protein 7 [Aplysia californica]|uniref:Epidermal growth factor-like protein 7 n=1 Tax=Aplysia californica TaxID=6500 RepID=A0ABM1W271_APLCA|nr:epidermal growth factor-like protein 7 [Aplysia californica]